VRLHAYNVGSPTNSTVLLIYVGGDGEARNGSNIPTSQTNWHVEITGIAVPDSGPVTVTWDATAGVTYDVYTSVQRLGDSAMTWTKEVIAQVAAGASADGAANNTTSQRYYQVALQGHPTRTNHLWAVIRPAIEPGFNLVAAPVTGYGLAVNGGGSIGAALAYGLTGHAGGAGDGTGDELFLLQANGSYVNLYLDGGVWKETGGSASVRTLQAGQGVLVLRNGAATSSPFAGPVGNTRDELNTVPVGWSIMGLSHGRHLTPEEAFSSLASGSLVGSSDDNQADMIIFLSPSGTYTPIQRLGSPYNYWMDLTTEAAAGYVVRPGKAFFYQRRSSELQVRF
jgi:hypothetical protein